MAPSPPDVRLAVVTIGRWLGLSAGLAAGLPAAGQAPATVTPPGDTLPALAHLRNAVDTLLGAGDTLRWRPGAIFAHTLRASSPSGDSLAITVEGARAWVTAPTPGLASARWRFRRFDTRLRVPYAALDSARLGGQRPFTTWGAYDGDAGGAIGVSALRQELGNVNYSGVFGRGLRFGNSQNLVLDSRLDLQLEGDLGEGLTVAAVVSDQNIPLQPEGNTVQLREFDRLFVTVARGPDRLTAGDYTLRSNAGHFIRFDKNLQGLSYAREATAARPLDGQVSLAAARGDFRRIRLSVVDGNQGPYRLTGAQGEPFVVVLAGTERVFLDGRLLERGLDRDYVIDYNRGEVTFMPRLLVNRFQRIIVEYEYADREYLRSLVSAEAHYDFGPVELRVQGLQQQDGLRRSGAALSEAAQRTLLSTPGTEAGVLVPSALALAPGSANPIRYVRRPGGGDCRADSVWVLAEGSAEGSAGFAVAFTEVGDGGGDYELAFGASANGAVFRAVPRDRDCRPRGRYAAVRLVQTPRSLQVVTLGATAALDSATAIDLELAGNRRTLNRYSDADATAAAAHLRVTHARPLAGGRLGLRAYGEATGDGFEVIAPWRSPEFRRLWNLGGLSDAPTGDPGRDWLAGGGIDFARRGLTLAYGLDAYTQADRYQGFRQNWTAALARGPYRLRHGGNALAAYRDGATTAQSRLELTGERLGARWQHAAGVTRTRSENYDLIADAPGAADRAIVEWHARTTRLERDSAWSATLAYSGRHDGSRDASTVDPARPIVPAGEGTNHQIDLTASSPSGRAQALDLTASYRHSGTAGAAATIADPPTQGGDYYLGRLAHRFAPRERAWLRTQTLLEAGSGQERRAAVQYLRVQAGLGEYVWRDYNGDGVEQLDEFEVAVFADSASYLRTVLLTDDFVATNTLTATEAIDLDAGKLPGGPQAWWGRLSASASANLRRRALQSAGYTRLLATAIAPTDTTVVGDDLGWRNALYFNRNRDAFRAELEYRQLSARSITLQGLQLNRTNTQALRLQQPIGRTWRLASELSRERRRSGSEALAQRNFATETFRGGPSVSFQPSPTIRGELGGDYRTARALGDSARVTAFVLRVEGELRLPESTPGVQRRNPLAGATLRGRVERIRQAFRGDPNSPVGFALLEGLRPGESWIWSLTTDQQLGRSLQLSLRYDGRQLGGGRVVHTGQAQLQAVF